MSNDRSLSPSILNGIRIVNLGVNVPAPVACYQLRNLGAMILKVEPPSGDPLQLYCKPWYEKLVVGQEVIRMDLKQEKVKLDLIQIIEKSQLLITSSRPSALTKLGLHWDQLKIAMPSLGVVAIVGYADPEYDRPGHDLTYLAESGLLDPHSFPKTLLADLAGAERVTQSALAILYAKKTEVGTSPSIVSLAEVVKEFSDPWRFGITKVSGILGGAYPNYHTYSCKSGWIAVAALEPQFKESLEKALKNDFTDNSFSVKGMSQIFQRQDADHWVKWGLDNNIPISKFGEN